MCYALFGEDGALSGTDVCCCDCDDVMTCFGDCCSCACGACGEGGTAVAEFLQECWTRQMTLASCVLVAIALIFTLPYALEEDDMLQWACQPGSAS